MSATARARGGYAPRNALNAQALKAAIDARSQARGDAADVRGWLLNHFHRHLVANFEPARLVRTLADAREAWPRGSPLPEWVAQRLGSAAKAEGASSVPMVWVDPAEPALLALEARLVEFLNARKGTALEGKLERINCPQAIALWDKEHAEMATRIERGWRQSQPQALRMVLETANGRFVEFLPDSPELRSEMAFESYAMRHCLGQFANRSALTGGYGEDYAQAIKDGRLRLLSFRDAQGQPHITISVEVAADGVLNVDQVKGKQNRPPIDRYVPDVLACLNALGTSDRIAGDCVAIGVVHAQAGWVRIEAVQERLAQTRLVARYPQLFARLAAPTPMVEWLVAARQPEQFREHPAKAVSVRYATRRPAQGAHGGHAGGVFVTEGVPWPGVRPR